MTRTAFNLVTISTLTFSTVAEARLMNAHLPPPEESSHTAVHVPTGCMARITVNGTQLVKAQITDPLCLPSGVRARDVPGKIIDFTIPPK